MKTFWKKKWFWIPIACLVIVAIFVCFFWSIEKKSWENSQATATASASATNTLTPTITATQTRPTATATAIATATVTPTATMTIAPTATGSVLTSSDDWKITWLAGADKDRGDGTFRQDAEEWVWRKVAPELWPTFPNVDNPLVPEFKTADGLEYAMDESNFCQQIIDEDCRVPVAAMHYLYFTGDYDIQDIGSCEEDESRIGCMLDIINVGSVTSDFTGMFGQGFRLHARYWNGNTLNVATWALVSHGSNSMMNMNSLVNPNGIQNAGANCSVPEGCEGVNIRIVFVSGNEILMMLETTVQQ